MAKLKDKKKILISAAVLLLTLLGLLFVLEKTKLTNFIKTKSSSGTQVQSTSDEPSARSDFTAEETTKQAGDTRAENKSDAGVTDRQGQSGAASSSKSIKSSSGEITVFAPSANAEIKESAEIYGVSTLKHVSYRLIDNVSGVVTTGELRVVDGKFAGTLSFTSNATEARLDIYATKEDGTEFSNIEIPLRIRQ